MRRYPHHECSCDDTDLSLAQAKGRWPDGSHIILTCGQGHMRSIPKERWEQELQRRCAAKKESPA